MAENDKRIQLRENVHQMVVNWSSRRGVSPSAFVSMVVYDYMRSNPDWSDLSTIQPPRAKAAKAPSIFGDDPPMFAPKPDLAPADVEALAVWGSDDDEDEYNYGD